MADSFSSVVALIEDDHDVRTLIATMARIAGHVVVEGSTFTEGRQLLLEYPWDLAIISQELQDGSGLDLCREVSARSGETHRHIVLIGADDSQEVKLAGFDAGADEYITKPFDVIELRARLRAITRAAVAQKALLVRLSSLEQLSVVDGLTQVYNHRFFQLELRRIFDVAMRHRRPLALAMIDIDHFKRVNDTHGHRVGDQVLIEVSTILVENIRSSDTLSRYGGEEFALILPETSSEEAAILAERVRNGVEQTTISTSAGDQHVTISVGFATIPHPDISSAARLIEAADRALYVAKRAGRNRIEGPGDAPHPTEGENESERNSPRDAS